MSEKAKGASPKWATFDCYGTLIDWERGIAQTFARLWPQAHTETLLGTYHEIEPRIQKGSDEPYRDVLTEALRRVAEAAGLPLSEADADGLARSLPDWPPFDEVPQALREIRARRWKIAILSNTDPELLDASIRRIGVEVDARVTVAEARSYKPAPGHWQRFFEATGADAAHHVHVGASLFHDIEPAGRLGLRAVWINRAGETSGTPRVAELPDLAALPDQLDALVGG